MIHIWYINKYYVARCFNGKTLQPQKSGWLTWEFRPPTCRRSFFWDPWWRPRGCDVSDVWCLLKWMNIVNNGEHVSYAWNVLHVYVLHVKKYVLHAENEWTWNLFQINLWSLKSALLISTTRFIIPQPFPQDQQTSIQGSASYVTQKVMTIVKQARNHFYIFVHGMEYP